VPRRRRPGFIRGLAVTGRQLFAASFGRKPYGAAAAAHGTPGDRAACGPRRIPLPRPPAPRPSHQRRGECASSRENVTVTGTERRALSRLAPPASTVLRIPLRGTRLRRAVDPGASASPTGLTARARPQARPERRAARPRGHRAGEMTKSRVFDQGSKVPIIR
jgi:hypothetical protein